MTSEINKEDQPKKYRWLKWGFILSLIGVGAYFLVKLLPGDFAKSAAFTQYKELKDTVLLTVADTIADLNDTLMIAEDSLNLADSISMGAAVDSTGSGLDSTFMATRVIDESYKFGEGSTTDDQKTGANNLSGEQGSLSAIPVKTDMFNELLFSAASQDSLRGTHEAFLADKVVSSKTILKIIATVGKDVLINGNTQDTKEIFESIVEEDNIVGILIANRKGVIIYSSNSKFVNGNIKQVFPILDTTTHMIGQSVSSQQLITSLAIYHTYGQIGNVVLVTQE